MAQQQWSGMLPDSAGSGLKSFSRIYPVFPGAKLANQMQRRLGPSSLNSLGH